MDDRELFMLVVLIGVILVATLMNNIFKDHEELQEIKEDCKRHNWSTNPKTNQLQCTKCNYVAGTYQSEHGEY